MQSRPEPDVSADEAACPSESTILALWRGKLGLDARAGVEEHLAQCAACRELVSVLAPTSASPSQPAAPAAAPVVVGQIVADKYQVERVLGRGGMGWVVRARHLVLRTPVALKFLLPQAAERPEAVLRFIREARAAALLDSEHVVRVLDAGKLAGSGEPYLALEYLEGIDLAQYVAQRGPLPIEEAVGYVRQASAALDLAHAHGIVHRDIKPANLFLMRRGDGRSIIKVLDFGIAKIAHAVEGGLTDGDLTTGAAVMGSPRYMAPEQIHSSKRVDHRADVWALGVVLFELLTGKLPFDGDTLMSLCAAIVTDPPASLRALRGDVPPALEAAVLACFEKDPARRMPTVAALAEAIASFAGPDDRVSVGPAARRRTPMPAAPPGALDNRIAFRELGADTGPAVAASANLPPPRRGAIAVIVMVGATAAFAAGLAALAATRARQAPPPPVEVVPAAAASNAAISPLPPPSNPPATSPPPASASASAPAASAQAIERPAAPQAARRAAAPTSQPSAAAAASAAPSKEIDRAGLLDRK